MTPDGRNRTARGFSGAPFPCSVSSRVLESRSESSTLASVDLSLTDATLSYTLEQTGSDIVVAGGTVAIDAATTISSEDDIVIGDNDATADV